MNKYTKHRIHRIRDLNEKYYEIVFQKESLKFQPGDTVTFYKGPEIPVFIASGIQEPWIRLILDRDLFPKPPFGERAIKLNTDVESKLPSLAGDKAPNFVFETGTIGAFFSWASTFPGVKCKVLYLGQNKIQEDWIAGNHKVIKTVTTMKKAENLYVTGNRDLFKGKAGALLDVCKESYLY